MATVTLSNLEQGCPECFEPGGTAAATMGAFDATGSATYICLTNGASKFTAHFAAGRIPESVEMAVELAESLT